MAHQRNTGGAESHPQSKLYTWCPNQPHRARKRHTLTQGTQSTHAQKKNRVIEHQRTSGGSCIIAFRSLINRSRAGVAGPLMMARTPSHTFRTQGESVREREPVPRRSPQETQRLEEGGRPRQGDKLDRAGRPKRTKEQRRRRLVRNKWGGEDTSGCHRPRGSRPGLGRLGGEGGCAGRPVEWRWWWSLASVPGRGSVVVLPRGGGRATCTLRVPIGPGGGLCLMHDFHRCFAVANAEIREFSDSHVSRWNSSRQGQGLAVQDRTG